VNVLVVLPFELLKIIVKVFVGETSEFGVPLRRHSAESQVRPRAVSVDRFGSDEPVIVQEV
jgi:hypothetical protein